MICQLLVLRQHKSQSKHREGKEPQALRVFELPAGVFLKGVCPPQILPLSLFSSLLFIPSASLDPRLFFGDSTALFILSTSLDPRLFFFREWIASSHHPLLLIRDSFLSRLHGFVSRRRRLLHPRLVWSRSDGFASHRRRLFTPESSPSRSDSFISTSLDPGLLSSLEELRSHHPRLSTPDSSRRAVFGCRLLASRLPRPPDFQASAWNRLFLSFVSHLTGPVTLEAENID